jgi:hypothetical protein
MFNDRECPTCPGVGGDHRGHPGGARISAPETLADESTLRCLSVGAKTVTSPVERADESRSLRRHRQGRLPHSDGTTLPWHHVKAVVGIARNWTPPCSFDGRKR